MITRKEHLSHIDHHTDNIRHLLLDDLFINSDFLTMTDIIFIVNSQVTLIQSHTAELLEMEK
ncbi:hypothetical protein ES707_14226 [subsurface metagenome]